jgi:hypothetical protein
MAIRNVFKPFDIFYGYLVIYWQLGLFLPVLVYLSRKIWQPWCGGYVTFGCIFTVNETCRGAPQVLFWRRLGVDNNCDQVASFGRQL